MNKRKKKIPTVGRAIVRRRIFIRGKQKMIEEEYMDGIPMCEWIENIKDPIFLMENGDYDKLDDCFNSGENWFTSKIRDDSNNFINNDKINDEPPF